MWSVLTHFSNSKSSAFIFKNGNINICPVLVNTWPITLVDLILHSGSGDEGVLYEYLVNATGGYNNKVRPLLNHSHPVIVNIDFQLLSIIDLVSIIKASSDSIKLCVFLDSIKLCI